MNKLMAVLKQRIIKYIVDEKELKEDEKLSKNLAEIRNIKIKKVFNLIIVK